MSRRRRFSGELKAKIALDVNGGVKMYRRGGVEMYCGPGGSLSP